MAVAAVPALPQAHEPVDPSQVAVPASPDSSSASAAEPTDRVLLLPTRRALGTLRLFESRSPWVLSRGPAHVDGVRTASYPVDAGFVRVVPSVLVLPLPEFDAPGLVAVGVERSAAGDPLRWKAELGWSGVSSGSFEVDYRADDRTVVVRGEDRPALAALLPGGRTPGTLVESRWSERLDARTSATARMANNRLDIEGRDPAAASARVELRHRPAEAWTVLARVDGATYSDAGVAGYRRSAVTVGTDFDRNGIGITALVRSEASPAVDGGRGGRVAVRGTAGALRATAFADFQQQAETVALDLADPANLPRDFGESGLVGMRPELAVQALRDRPAFHYQHGVATGALRVDPLRVQGGLDVAWRASSSATEFGVRVAYDGLDGSAGARRALLGGLYTSWRVFGEADLTASYANWTLRDGAETDDTRGLFRMSLSAPL